MIPIRFLFRSRWAALAWAGTICLSAANFAKEHRTDPVDAAKSSDTRAAQNSALAAEDAD